MQVLFTRLFLRDIEKITDEGLKNEVKNAVESFETANHLSDMVNVRKMKGYKTAYRLRIGGYKIGFHYDGDCVKLTRFLKRDTIYNLFP
jgi:mRNA-degrading endonuclease RelE of RelBE toxin-antitoxin system